MVYLKKILIIIVIDSATSFSAHFFAQNPLHRRKQQTISQNHFSPVFDHIKTGRKSCDSVPLNKKVLGKSPLIHANQKCIRSYRLLGIMVLHVHICIVFTYLGLKIPAQYHHLHVPKFSLILHQFWQVNGGGK